MRDQFSFRTLSKENLRKLNSITKYPSIPTFHKLGEKRVLLNKVNVNFKEDDVIQINEKVDGTNARIILSPKNDEWLLGSREEFLCAKGDFIGDSSQGIFEPLIIEALREKSTLLLEKIKDYNVIWVIYGELYGGNIGRNSKQYTTKNDICFRVFDIKYISYSELSSLFSRSLPEISILREKNDMIGHWECGSEIIQIGEWLNFDTVPLIDRISLTAHHPLINDKSPITVKKWLSETIPTSLCMLDGQAGGKPEGVVIRTNDRSRICKIRFEDYRKV